MKYKVELSPLALKLLSQIKDRREQQIIRKRLLQLKYEPEKQGKPLTGLLQGYRSIRAVGQRYRIVYQIFEEKVTVAIVGVGRRKEGNKRDIYTLMEKLLENQESSE